MYHVFDIFIMNTLGYFKEKLHTRSILHSGSVAA